MIAVASSSVEDSGGDYIDSDVPLGTLARAAAQHIPSQERDERPCFGGDLGSRSACWTGNYNENYSQTRCRPRCLHQIFPTRDPEM